MPKGISPLKYIPTPHQIREECAAIRAEWSTETRLARMSPALRPFVGLVDGNHHPMAASDYEAHLGGSGSCQE